MNSMRKKLFITAALLLLFATGAFACEFTYMIRSSDGKSERVIPGRPAELESGESYTLTVSYREDHKNCIVAPEDTLFLVEEERWREGKDYLALTLVSSEGWKSDGRSHEASFVFTASKQGEWPLEVIRECTRGGYKATLLFRVA